jgi:hypothetical protein
MHPVQVTETTHGFNAGAAERRRTQFTAQITDVHIDAAVIPHRFAPTERISQLVDHFTTHFLQML